MRNLIAAFLKLVVVVFIGAGVYLVYKSMTPMNAAKAPLVEQQNDLSPEAVLLKNHLLKYKTPQRVEIRNLTQRLIQDGEEIKKIKIPLRQDSKFYITVDLFTDENDPKAPLVAQIQFYDIKTENKIKEESINLN